MTTPVLDKLTDVQSSVVGYISTVKEPITTGVSTVVEFVIDRFPSIPAVPYADQIPTPKELIDNQAKFASKLVTTNKSVALAAAKAAAPLTDQLLDRTATPVKAAKAATAA